MDEEREYDMSDDEVFKNRTHILNKKEMFIRNTRSLRKEIEDELKLDGIKINKFYFDKIFSVYYKKNKCKKIEKDLESLKKYKVNTEDQPQVCGIMAAQYGVLKTCIAHWNVFNEHPNFSTLIDCIKERMYR